MDESIQFTRVLRRRVFPFVVVLLTILVVLYFLDKTDKTQETIMVPD